MWLLRGTSDASSSSSDQLFRGEYIELPTVDELALELVDDGRARYGLRSPMSSSSRGGSSLSLSSEGAIDDGGESQVYCTKNAIRLDCFSHAKITVYFSTVRSTPFSPGCMTSIHSNIDPRQMVNFPEVLKGTYRTS